MGLTTNTNIETPRERMLRRQEEERMAKIITDDGERLGLSWYKYNDEFYQVYNGKILRSRQKRLLMNVKEGWFILDIEHTNACLVYIDGYEKILNGVSPEDIVIYPDKYYLFLSPLNRVKELWRMDSQILVADDIYRLNETLWCLCSNGIYYLSNLNSRESIPIGKYPLHYDPDKYILFYVDLENNQQVNINYIMGRF